MPVAIAGMHRSGTSMVTRLLNLCGLDLGPTEQLMQPAPDNPEGFWESMPFVRINEELLQSLNGAWDWPPEELRDWAAADELAAYRERAANFPSEFGFTEPWGWKDPRNSLTLGFWQTVWPELRVVVCVRNPLEVASSLGVRDATPFLKSLRLWGRHHEDIFDLVPAERRIVCQYDAFFVDPNAELRRLLGFLKIEASDETIAKACATVSRGLRHNEVAIDDLAAVPGGSEVVELYLRLIAEAGPRAAASPPGAKKSKTLVNVIRGAVKMEERILQLEERHREQERVIRQMTQDLIERTAEWEDASAMRDYWKRAYRDRMSARRHRYADQIAEFMLKVSRPLRPRKDQPVRNS
jgi:uncharacterized coiled-coil protein SlyX